MADEAICPICGGFSQTLRMGKPWTCDNCGTERATALPVDTSRSGRRAETDLLEVWHERRTLLPSGDPRRTR